MYELLSYLRRSPIKLKILKALNEPQTPVDLKKKLNLHRESISRALIGMEKKGLVKCLNPNQPNFRYYRLTKKGKELLAMLD